MLGNPEAVEVFKKLDINENLFHAGTTKKVLGDRYDIFPAAIATHILQWRQYSKLHSTYTSSLSDHADKEEYIHLTNKQSLQQEGFLLQSQIFKIFLYEQS